jgi:hypothetical protein
MVITEISVMCHIDVSVCPNLHVNLLSWFDLSNISITYPKISLLDYQLFPRNLTKSSRADIEPDEPDLY